MPDKALYIQMFSIHGLVRGQNLELGRDADTGGQVRYVVELAEHLSQLDGIRRVDLFTRWTSDKAVSDDYAQPVEVVGDRFRIIRIRCGGAKYRRKELLWPYLDEYIDKTIKFIRREEAIPDLVHGHYPDAGYVAMHLSRIFGAPFVFTGHSLGRVKKQKLINDGMRPADIDKKYKIEQRIAVEEEILEYADMVIASTHQEVAEQYGMYRQKALPRFEVIPPGLDVDKFYPFYHDMLPGIERNETGRYAQASVLQELDRFFMHPDKPLILALCRPDKRKNIQGLVKAYGEDLALQAMANLAVFAGIRKDISGMPENEREVLTEMLLLLDKYDLYGKMAIPKRHDFEYEVPELYRIAAAKRGVFVNPALTEPFGITLLEASAVGLPIVATNDGGPQDIVANCGNGILVDPTDSRAIADAIKEIIAGADQWDRFSKNGIENVRKYYTWQHHAEKYREKLTGLIAGGDRIAIKKAEPSDAIGRRLAGLNYFIITDIDNTLIGEDNSRLSELVEILRQYREWIGFGVATGRSVESAYDFLEAHGVSSPDVMITSVGAEIYYGRHLQSGKGWETHISSRWNREKIVKLLQSLDFLKYQPEAAQRRFKISYDMAPGKDRLAAVHGLLQQNKCRYQLIYSHQQYLDILPFRASKGKAIRYLSYKWEIPLRNFLVCGDSGNDEEMLRGEPFGVVVGNYSSELESLKGARRVFFARASCAGGILEGIQKYRFLERTGGKNI